MNANATALFPPCPPPLPSRSSRAGPCSHASQACGKSLPLAWQQCTQKLGRERGPGQESWHTRPACTALKLRHALLLPLLRGPSTSRCCAPPYLLRAFLSASRSPHLVPTFVHRMATDTCSDVYNEHEEYLVEMAPKSCQDDLEKGTRTCSTRELVVDICAKGFKWCSIDAKKTNDSEL